MSQLLRRSGDAFHVYYHLLALGLRPLLEDQRAYETVQWRCDMLDCVIRRLRAMEEEIDALVSSPVEQPPDEGMLTELAKAYGLPARGDDGKITRSMAALILLVGVEIEIADTLQLTELVEGLAPPVPPTDPSKLN